MVAALVQDLRVDLVSQDPEVARPRDVGDLADHALRQHPAGRILGTVEDDELRAVGDERPQLVEIGVEVVLLAQHQRHGLRAAERDHRRIDREAGVREDRLVARIEEREHREEHDRLRAGRDDDLSGVHREVAGLVQVRGDGFPQLRHARRRGVVGLASLERR